MDRRLITGTNTGESVVGAVKMPFYPADTRDGVIGSRRPVAAAIVLAIRRLGSTISLALISASSWGSGIEPKLFFQLTSGSLFRLFVHAACAARKIVDPRVDRVAILSRKKNAPFAVDKRRHREGNALVYLIFAQTPVRKLHIVLYQGHPSLVNHTPITDCPLLFHR